MNDIGDLNGAGAFLSAAAALQKKTGGGGVACAA